MNDKTKKYLKFMVIAVVFFSLSIGGGYFGAFLYGSGQGGSKQIIKTSALDKATTNISEISKAAADSVVEISTETVTSGVFMQDYISEGAGSGVIIASDGYIITNNHVIDGASTFKVRLKNGDEYDAKLIGGDAISDIAVLKIEAKDLTVAVVGDSDKLEVGENVVAIGNPLGKLGGTVTEGIISATSRQITIDGVKMTLLQTSAAINPGNSGGGLFNNSGQLVGVVNAKSSGDNVEGLGFAVPVNTAVDVAKQLMDQGYVKGNYMLGVKLSEVKTEAEAKKIGVEKVGVYIFEVVSGGDADKMGLKKGDYFISINGKKIDNYDTASAIIKKNDKGDTIKVVIERDGAEKTLSLQI